MERYEGNVAGLRQHYEENIELVYTVGNTFCIDEDLKSLGVGSNRKTTTLKTLIELLADESKAQVARKCLKHYTDQTFTSAEQWRQWYEQNAQRLVFSDRGGYRFYLVPGTE